MFDNNVGVLICGKEFSDDLIGRIGNAVANEPELTRASLSRKVCERMGWVDRQGKFQEMSCRVALLKLFKRGVIPLPAPVRLAHFCHSNTGVAIKPILVADKFERLECSFSDLGEIDLVRINRAQKELSSLVSRTSYG